MPSRDVVDVLADVDAVLDEWESGPDAARWSPDGSHEYDTSGHSTYEDAWLRRPSWRQVPVGLHLPAGTTGQGMRLEAMRVHPGLLVSGHDHHVVRPLRLASDPDGGDGWLLPAAWWASLNCAFRRVAVAAVRARSSLQGLRAAIVIVDEASPDGAGRDASLLEAVALAADPLGWAPTHPQWWLTPELRRPILLDPPPPTGVVWRLSHATPAPQHRAQAPTTGPERRPGRGRC